MKKGFTLLEMVFVLTVVTIVFLLTVPNIKKVLTVVYNKGCDAQLKVVDAAILQYQLSNDEEPSSVSDLVLDGFITEQQTQCQDNRQIEISDGQAYAS